jgi:hypothetical protein
MCHRTISYDFFNVNLSQRNQTYVNNTYQAYYIYKVQNKYKQMGRLISQRETIYQALAKFQLRLYYPL